MQDAQLTPGNLGLSRPEQASGAVGGETLLVDRILGSLLALVRMSTAPCGDARTIPLLDDVAVEAARAIAVGFPLFYASAAERYDALVATVSAAAAALRAGAAWELPLLDSVCAAMSSPRRLEEVLPGQPWTKWSFGDTERSGELSAGAIRAAFDSSLATYERCGTAGVQRALTRAHRTIDTPSFAASTDGVIISGVAAIAPGGRQDKYAMLPAGPKEGRWSASFVVDSSSPGQVRTLVCLVVCARDACAGCNWGVYREREGEQFQEIVGLLRALLRRLGVYRRQGAAPSVRAVIANDASWMRGSRLAQVAAVWADGDCACLRGCGDPDGALFCERRPGRVWYGRRFDGASRLCCFCGL